MRITYQFKLYTSKRNKHLHALIDLASWVYNHCIALIKRYYRIYKRHLSKYKLQKHITKLKKLQRYSSWRALGSQAIQDITDRIDRAYKLFFDAVKKQKKCSPPGFKKKRKYKSFTLKQAGYELLEENKLRIGQKIYKYHRSRKIEGLIKTVTVKRDALGDMYLYFSCEKQDSKPERVATGKSVGLDFGLKVFLTTSDGKEIATPLFYKQASRAIRDANKRVSSKVKGSHNRKKAAIELARCHKRISNKRKDNHFKLAQELVQAYDYIYVEDLNIKGMQRLWGKKISDLGFSNFLKILEYTCSKYGSRLLQIDRYYPSSKQCHTCLAINDSLSLKDREWVCPSCLSVLQRDYNAAINIKRVGTSTHGLESVRLSKDSCFCMNPESRDFSRGSASIQPWIQLCL